MAKGSAFMGQIRGKLGNVVGSVVMNSANKEKQMFRAYQPVVSNPRTVRQSDQRMVISAASTFYSKFSEILDHSFEGCKEGQQNQNRFMKLAMTHKNSPYTNKGYNKLVPGLYQISEGSLPQMPVDFVGQWDNSSDDLFKKYVVTFPGISMISYNGTSSGSFLSNNSFLRENDQITVVLFFEDNVPGGALSYSYLLTRAWVDPTSQFLLFDFPDSLDLTYQRLGNSGGSVADSDSLAFVSEGKKIVAAAMIISRWDGKIWQRSDAFLSVSDKLFADWYSDTRFDAALSTYQNTQASRSSDSDLYLNQDGTLSVIKFSNMFIVGADNKTKIFAVGIDASAKNYLFANSSGQVLGKDWSPVIKSTGETTVFYTTSDFSKYNIITTTRQSKPSLPYVVPYADISMADAATVAAASFTRAMARSANLAKRAAAVVKPSDHAIITDEFDC